MEAQRGLAFALDGQVNAMLDEGAEPLDERRVQEALVTLGARRRFDRARLVQLVDILWDRDKEGVLADLLRQAAREGSLDLLRDEGDLPEELQPAASELADLLDPEVPLADPL